MSNLSQKRLRFMAALRLKYPLLLFMPGFLLGQLLTQAALAQAWPWVLGAIVSGLVIVWLGAGTSPKRWCMVLNAAGFVAGMGTFIGCVPKSNHELSEATPYVVQVLEEPRYHRPGEVTLRLQILAQLNADLELGPAPLMRLHCRAIDLPWRNVSQLQEKSVFVMHASYKSFSWKANPFAWENYQLRRGINGDCKILYASQLLKTNENWRSDLRQYLRHQVQAILGEGETAGFVLAMSLGFRDMVSQRTERAFEQTGLSHLLVVSGAQVSLLFLSAWKIALWLLLRFRLLEARLFAPNCAVIFGVVMSCAFVWLVGLEGSSVRAGIAVLVVASSGILERESNLMHSLLIALLMLCIVWPGAFLEPGVQLTFGALTGIWLGIRYRGPRWLIFLAANLYATLFASLLSCAWFGTFSLSGFALNPILGWLASLVGCEGCLLAILLLLSGIDSHGLMLQLCAWLLNGFKALLIEVAGFSSLSFYFPQESSRCWFILTVLLSLGILSQVYRRYSLLK